MYGQNPNRGGYKAHGFSMEDIFSRFGDVFGGNPFGNFGQSPPQRRGNDLRVHLTLTLDEIFRGVNKKVKYKRQQSCQSCRGIGGQGEKTCHGCNGFGRRNFTQTTPFGQISQTMMCNICQGSGKEVSNRCGTCSGHGTIESEEIVDITIPRGVMNGMTMNLQGHGNYIKNGIAGDLQVLIEEVAHNKFRREGNDLHCEEWITISQAVLGDSMKIESFYGEQQLAILPGTESGKIVKVHGKGLPVMGSSGSTVGVGDLYVKFNVKIPKALNEDQAKIFEKLRTLE